MNKTEHTDETMQVRGGDLDRLLSLAGEVIVASSNHVLAYRNLQALADNRLPVSAEALAGARDMSATMNEISGNLHHLVQSIRTISLRDMLLRARRLVRDVARRTGKRVRFEVQGEATTVDKSIIEQLWDPIAHQLRNAVDHGIEDALERGRQGKEEEGLVSLSAWNTERETVIRIEDDGRGIDMERLREKASEHGLLSGGQPLTDEQALRLLCTPGFSTVTSVSQTSGRGVGMDVVRNVITGLGGSIQLTNRPGRGVTFTFRVPIVSAVNIVDTLVVRVGTHQFGIPIHNVVTTAAAPRERIHHLMGKGRAVQHLGALITLCDLGDLMHVSDQDDDNADEISVIIIEHQKRQLALRVSECLAPQKLVIIPFGAALDTQGLAGSTIMGGRRLGFIIDPAALIHLADNQGHADTDAARPPDTPAHPALDLHDPGDATRAVETPPGVEPAADTGPEGTQDDEDGTPEEREAMIREYVTEIERLTPQVNRVLFEIENNREDAEALNLAFRLFHTLKGNLIMMGLPAAGETVHFVESLMDGARSRELAITPEVMDVLMDGAAFVEEVARNLRSGDRRDKTGDHVIRCVKQLLPAREQKTDQTIERVSDLDYEFSHEAAFREKAYRRRRVPFYQMLLEFDPGDQPAFLVAVLIYNRICQVGDVLATVPRLTDMENGMVRNEIKLLFASEKDADALERGLRELLCAHYGVTRLAFGRHG